MGGVADLLLLGVSVFYFYFRNRNYHKYIKKEMLNNSAKEFKEFFPKLSQKEVDGLMG